jgi:arylsulfatase A-like enzyme
LQYLLHNTYLLPRKLENKIRFINDSERATNKAIEIIKENREENFFLWIHFMDSHIPHFFPNYMINKFLPNKEGKKIFEILNAKGYKREDMDFLKHCWKFDETTGGITARYDTGILYDDFLVGKIINTLKEEGLLKDTIIFLFADHGESLGEHEIYFTHVGLYDVSLHIPLVMVGKGIPKDKKINSLTQLEDLAPTVLDLIGVKYNPDTFDGKSLLPLLSGEKKEIRESIFMEENGGGLRKRAIRTKKNKYMESPDKENLVCETCNTTHGPITALYDLEKDPDENINLAEKNKKLTKEMKLKLDETLRDLKKLNEKRRIQILIKKNKLL